MIKFFKRILNLFVKKNTTEVRIEVTHRIPKTTYMEVVKKLPNTYAGNDTTEVEAAFKLGVAHAKEVFEREMVV